MPILKSSVPTDSAPTLMGGTDSRDPKARARPGEPGSLGSQAFNDSLFLVVGAWAVMLLLTYSLRNHNV